jgi:uncharacterized FlaG/YvyC family protein
MDVTQVNGTNIPVGATHEVPPQQAAENRSIIPAVKAVNESEMFGQDNQLVFQRDPQSQRMVIQVVNQQTHEVVSQIPPEYVVQLADDLKRQETEATPAKIG